MALFLPLGEVGDIGPHLLLEGANVQDNPSDLVREAWWVEGLPPAARTDAHEGLGPALVHIVPQDSFGAEGVAQATVAQPTQPIAVEDQGPLAVDRRCALEYILVGLAAEVPHTSSASPCTNGNYREFGTKAASTITHRLT